MALGKLRWAIALGFVSFTASFPHVASACPSHDQLTRKDFAAANVVFEGTVAAIHPTKRKFTYGGKTSERVVGMDITFNIGNVIRGSLEQRSIRVGWIHGTFGYPRSISELREWYGETLRIGLITPEGMTDDCSRHRNIKKTETGFERELIKINCKVGYGAENSPDARSGYPSDKAYILNGYCTGPYMFKVTSLRDDPSRDLSRNKIGEEGFQLANSKEVSNFTRAYIKENPEMAAQYSTDKHVRATFMRDLSTYANFDVSRLEPLEDLTPKDYDDMSEQGIEAYFFIKLAARVFENEYKYYQIRKAVEEK